MSLSCPRCDRPSAIGETCPEHGLHGVAPGAREQLDDAPLLGRILNGQFALTGLIGQGGMGTVYRGLDLTLHRELAVKVLHAHLTAARKDRERFEREARALSRLRSGSTVTLFQFGVVREGPWRTWRSWPWRWSRAPAWRGASPAGRSASPRSWTSSGSWPTRWARPISSASFTAT